MGRGLRRHKWNSVKISKFLGGTKRYQRFFLFCVYGRVLENSKRLLWTKIVCISLTDLSRKTLSLDLTFHLCITMTYPLGKKVYFFEIA